MILLLLATALAEGPPARPVPTLPVEHECLKAVGIDFGEPFPSGLSINSKGACAGVLLPVSQAADLANLQTWAEAQESWWKIEAARWDHDQQALHNELVACESNLTTASQEPPVWQRPRVAFVGGVAVGAAVILGGAYAIGQVAQ